MSHSVTVWSNINGGHTTKIRMLYNMDQEVMFSDAIIEPLQKTLAYKGF